MSALPSPPGRARVVFGHLPEWGRDPVALLEQGARLGQVFELRLQNRTFVGYSSAWNKAILSDLETFTSKESLSKVVPYLSGGIITRDAPEHKADKAGLLRQFYTRPMGDVRQVLRDSFAANMPLGEFDALEWADIAVQRALNAVFFSGQFGEALLAAYLAPLRKPVPAPLLPRPLLFRRFGAELGRLLERRRAEGGHDILAHVAPLENAHEEIRIALGAAHDTTTHSLAWATWLITQHPQYGDKDGIPLLVKETLRLYPPGWVGSRKVSRKIEIEGVTLPRGAMVFYSPYLTHRDPLLWDSPLEFRPERFKRGKPPAWGYLPYGAGERICLGMNLAGTLLEEALGLLVRKKMIPLSGDPTPVSGVTLGPRGPLMINRL